MAKQFEISCEHCDKDIFFEIDEVTGLGDHIDREVSDARQAAAEDFDGLIDPDDLLRGGARGLRDLAVAIRQGNRFEAELHLDRLAETLGPEASEAVQQGRFSPEARRQVYG